MTEPPAAVKWGLEDVSAGRSLQEKTATAVLMDTISTPSAFVSLFYVNLRYTFCSLTSVHASRLEYF